MQTYNPGVVTIQLLGKLGWQILHDFGEVGAQVLIEADYGERLLAVRDHLAEPLDQLVELPHPAVAAPQVVNQLFRRLATHLQRDSDP